jgi:hypothetical protein
MRKCSGYWHEILRASQGRTFCLLCKLHVATNVFKPEECYLMLSHGLLGRRLVVSEVASRTRLRNRMVLT